MASRRAQRYQERQKRQRRKRLGLVLAAALIGIVGVITLGFVFLGSGSDQTTASSPGGTTANANGDGLDFAVETLDGDTFRLSDHQGQPVAIFAMAGWCASCVPEAQAWSELYPEYQERGVELLVLSVDPSDSPEQLANFQARSGSRNLPHWAIDKDGSITRLLDIRTLDQTLLIDASGEVVYTDYQPSGTEQLRTALDEALQS